MKLVYSVSHFAVENLAFLDSIFVKASN